MRSIGKGLLHQLTQVFRFVRQGGPSQRLQLTVTIKQREPNHPSKGPIATGRPDSIPSRSSIHRLTMENPPESLVAEPGSQSASSPSKADRPDQRRLPPVDISSTPSDGVPQPAGSSGSNTSSRRDPNVNNRSFSRSCGKIGTGLRHTLHLIWLDLLCLLVLFGATGAILKWASPYKSGTRYFPVERDEFGAWRGARHLSYPLLHGKAQVKDVDVGTIFNIPTFIVPIWEFTVFLPIAVSISLIVMQIWVRNGRDKMAAGLGLFKAFAVR